MKFNLGPTLLFLLLAFLATRPDAAAAQAGAVDSKARALVAATADQIASLEQFQFDFETTVSFLDPGQGQVSTTRKGQLSLHREYGIQARIGAREMFYDTQTFTLVDHNAKVYAVEPAPTDFDQALEAAMIQLNTAFPTADFLFSDPFDALLGGVRTGVHVGRGELDGVAVDHLSFTQPGVSWQLWLNTDGSPRQMKLVYLDDNSNASRLIRFGAWNHEPRLTAADFAFVAGRAMEKIEFLRSAAK